MPNPRQVNQQAIENVTRKGASGRLLRARSAHGMQLIPQTLRQIDCVIGVVLLQKRQLVAHWRTHGARLAHVSFDIAPLKVARKDYCDK